jgi:WASH complex subunit strumpellin
VLNFTTEQECNSFGKNKILPFQSTYQSKEIPIPLNIISPPSSATVGDLDYAATTFLGRLANELIVLTDPKSTLYLMATSSWYDLKTHAPLLTPEYFGILESGLGISGINGLDKVFCFMIADQMQVPLFTTKTCIISVQHYFDCSLKSVIFRNC